MKAGLNLFYPSQFKQGLNRGLIQIWILLPTLIVWFASIQLVLAWACYSSPYTSVMFTLSASLSGLQTISLASPGG